MHKTRTPLVTWLLAAWLMVTDKRGLSAYQLQRQLGLRHETAHVMLHKLRAAMVAPERTPLRGTVEVDESLLGAPKRGRPESEVYAKVTIVGAVEVREYEATDKKTGEAVVRTRPGRIRLRLIPGRFKDDLMLFIGENIEEGSTVVTDALVHYGKFTIDGYKHRIESTARGMDRDDVLKHYHLVVSNLKTWLAGTHHGRVEPKHLQAYLNEYVFRFNRRDNLFAGFARLLGIGTQIKGPEYEELYAESGTAGAWTHPNPRRKRRPA
jgi:transposase-like protein